MTDLKPERGYRPELDAVRLLAFLCVFVAHLLGMECSHMTQKLSLHTTLVAADTGAMGLCLFFALSAYLLTRLLAAERERTGNVAIRNFYVRRTLRIWPLYYLGLAIGVLSAAALRQPAAVNAYLWSAFFAGNIYVGLYGWFPGVMAILWSISIEEQFYLVWPWVVRCIDRRRLVWAALAMLALANAALATLGHAHAQTDSQVWTNTLAQLEMFAVGVLLAIPKARGGSRPRLGAAAALTGPLLWLAATNYFHIKQWNEGGRATGALPLMAGYALVALGCAMVLQGFCWMAPKVIPAIAAKLGRISYGLYVFHGLALAVASSLAARMTGMAFVAATGAAALAITVTLAAISYEYLESPFLRLKRRFEIAEPKRELVAGD